MSLEIIATDGCISRDNACVDVKQEKPTNPTADHAKETDVKASRIKCRCGVWSVKCGVWGGECRVWFAKCGVWCECKVGV